MRDIIPWLPNMTKFQFSCIVADIYESGNGDLIRKPAHCQRAECCVCEKLRKVRFDVDGGVTLLCEGQEKERNE